MNKTFKDPNTRYSDQGTPLAQAADALNAIGDVTETVDELTETVDELSEKVDLIPVPVVADEGKVLTATDDGSYELADVDALPAIASGDAGKVLTVNAGETGAEWAAASGGAPLQGSITIMPADSQLLQLAKGTVNFYTQTSNTGGAQNCNDSRWVIYDHTIIIRTAGTKTFIGFIEKNDAGGYKSFSTRVTWYRASEPDPSIESISATGGITLKWYDLSQA